MSDHIEDLKTEDIPVGERPLSLPTELPILPLRDTVLFPNSFMPLAVARESSVRLIDDAIASGKLIAVFTQRDASVDEPGENDLYRIGTATHIHKMFKLPDGSLRLIVQGLSRLALGSVVATQPYLRANVNAATEGHERQRPSRDRCPRAQHQDQFPAGGVAVPAAVRRPADARGEHQRTGPPRRLHRVESFDNQHDRSSRRCSRRSTSGRGWTTSTAF